MALVNWQKPLKLKTAAAVLVDNVEVIRDNDYAVFDRMGELYRGPFETRVEIEITGLSGSFIEYGTLVLKIDSAAAHLIYDVASKGYPLKISIEGP